MDDHTEVTVTASTPNVPQILQDEPQVAAGDVCWRGLGITYRQLDYWTVKGYLLAGPSMGSGHDRRWPVGEVVVAARMQALIALGVKVGKAAEYARTKVSATVAELLALEGGNE